MTRVALAVITLLAWNGPPATAQTGTARWTVEDQAGNVTPCRIHLSGPDGKPVRTKKYPFWRDHFVCEGTAELGLPTGEYTYTIEHGPEFESLSGKITVVADQTAEAKHTIKRIADLAKEGWWSGELHIHRPIEQIPLHLRAEDLHVGPVLTSWNQRNLWAERPRPENSVRHLAGDYWYELFGCEDEREGGALLYYRLDTPLDFRGSKREFPSPMKFVRQARQQPHTWIDVEKPFWWDVPTWIASGEMDSIGIANNHMNRSGVYPGEAWGKPRDQEKFPGVHGNGLWTQDIYYRLLDCGIRIPPSAGSASGVLPNPVGYNRVYVDLGPKFDYDKWWDGLKAGRSFVTNGPLLRVKAQGQWPGSVLRFKEDGKTKLELDYEYSGRDQIDRLEVIHNGDVFLSIPIRYTQAPNEQDQHDELSGTIHLDLPEIASGWFLIRVICKNDQTFRFASTAPWYVEVGDKKERISREDAAFFKAWTEERIGRIEKAGLSEEELDAVLAPHKKGLEFWQAKIDAANAE